jgi:hypothetical protein
MVPLKCIVLMRLTIMRIGNKAFLIEKKASRYQCMLLISTTKYEREFIVLYYTITGLRDWEGYIQLKKYFH